CQQERQQQLSDGSFAGDKEQIDRAEHRKVQRDHCRQHAPTANQLSQGGDECVNDSFDHCVELLCLSSCEVGMLAGLGVVEGKHYVFFGNAFAHKVSGNSVFCPVFLYPKLAIADTNVNCHPAHSLSVLPTDIHPNVVPVSLVDHKKSVDIGQRLSATKFDMFSQDALQQFVMPV